ncbi:MAG: cyclic nucleotide-binding domain-containing protein, partial [Desulfobacterales bacterium]|nr:cyclic nucleotide-binding domain-containing protein [Desulfobacterales bacterium]
MSENILLSGNLSFLKLADLLQLLGSGGSTGILRIKTKHLPYPGLVHLYNGNPVNASTGDAMGGIDALFSLFGWTEGQFEFIDTNVSATNFIKKSRMEIILEGLRLLDDGHTKRIGQTSIPKNIPSFKENVLKGPLVDYMYIVDEEDFHDNQKIVSEGKYGNWMWVIMSGIVDVFKETPEGSFKIISIGEGAFIGSIAAFLMKGAVRNASIIARGEVQLGVLDSQRLSVEFATMSDDLKDVIISLDKRLRRIDESIVDIYLKREKKEELIKGKKLFIKQGEDKKDLFIITNGEASVVCQTNSEELYISNLFERDFIGYIPFLNIGHEPYNASVYTSENIKIKPIDVN